MPAAEQPTDSDPDPDQLRACVCSVFDDGQHAANEPLFYALTGSHLYGTDDESSDFDLRGFHSAPTTQWALLDQPQEQIIVNQNGVTDGYEQWPDTDLVSYELRKFGSLLYQGNFNVIELVLNADPLINDGAHLRNLRRSIQEYLPLNLPYHYAGMATSNYERYLNPHRDGYDPTPKRYLYVIRGLLAAEYVVEAETTEPNVRSLAAAVGDDLEQDLVRDLVRLKRADNNPTLTADRYEPVHDVCQTVIQDRLDRDYQSMAPDYDRAGYREALNDWMLTVRGVDNG